MSKRKKICFLLPYHFSAKMGGAEYQAKLVLEELSKRNQFQIFYLCREAATNFYSKNYKVICIGNNTGYRRFGYYFDATNVYKVLREISPDIVYQNVACAYTGIAAFYAKKYGAKMIWHIASDNDLKLIAPLNIKYRIRDFIERLFINYGIKNADIIAGQTQNQNKLLRKRFKKECDVLIPIGHSKPKNIIRKSEKIKILWVANLKPIKQPEIFIGLAKEAFLNRFNDVSFIMMGRCENDEWSLKLLDMINKTPNILYLGELPNEEVNKLLSKAHLLVNTSIYEGFSNTFIQAWMRCVPVVSLNVDPDGILVRERIGFHSKNFEQLLSDVTRLIKTKALREEMGKRARSYAIANHSVEKMFKNLMVCFQ
jgi:glycosyltransferase involved in cell wall biosynthesis